MTTRTHAQFLAAGVIVEIPTFIPDFHASENARFGLRDAMGTAHEREHCEHYSNTFAHGRRVLGCWQRDMFTAMADDWVADGASLNGTSAINRAAHSSAEAGKYFGGGLSLAREQAISKMLVAGRKSYFQENDPRFVALAETFDDVSLLVERALVTITIGDELPRMLRPNETINFDAGDSIMVRLSETIATDSTGDFITLTVDDSYTLTWKLRVRSPDIPSRNGVTPGVVRDLPIAGAGKVLTLPQYFAAVASKNADESVVGVVLTIAVPTTEAEDE